MNVLFVTFTNKGGGATTALANLAKGLRSIGHNIFVLTKDDDGPLPRMIESIGGKVFYGPISLTVYPKGGRFIGRVKRLITSIFNWRESRKLIGKIIDEYRIDVVHSNVGPLNIALKSCQKRRIPHIWHLREYQELYHGMCFFPTKRCFNSLIHQPGNYNIAITQGVFNHYNLRPNIDCVIYDGVFSEAQKKEPFIKEKEDYFLFVGRIEEAKAPITILKPYSEFIKKYPTIRLKYAGMFSEEDVYYQRMREMISEYQIDTNVEFLGNRNDVYELMRHAKALIVPSWYEGFGFITAEGMLNNCLVIGRDTAGTKEQFDVGLRITGQEIGLRYIDDNSLLQCMYTAVENDTSFMQKKAREVTEKQYTLEKSANDVDLFYKHCISVISK